MTVTEEQVFIEAETLKGIQKIQRWLRKVKNTGMITQYANEFLSVNGMIEFRGPSEFHQYNHYALTERGEHYLTTGEIQ